jgi:hypothetical protein
MEEGSGKEHLVPEYRAGAPSDMPDVRLDTIA